MLALVPAGCTPAELARAFEVTAQTISNRVAQDARDRGAPLPGKDGLATAEREELVRLRRELQRVRMERDIPAKATAWFAGRNDAIAPPLRGGAVRVWLATSGQVRVVLRIRVGSCLLKMLDDALGNRHVLDFSALAIFVFLLAQGRDVRAQRSQGLRHLARRQHDGTSFAVHDGSDQDLRMP
jgi:transposase